MRNYAVRLSVDGAQVVENTLKRVGESGQDAMRKVGTGSADASSKVALFGAAASRSGGQVQNAAFQIGDFAVQVGNGTSASTALAQQLPQLLGSFGPLGAVLGAVVAIGVPLGAAFFNMGDGARDAGEAAEDLADAASRLRDINDALSRSNEDLTETYGRNADAVRQLLTMQAALAQLDFGQQSRAQAQSLADAFGDLDRTMSPAEAEAGWTAFEMVLYSVRDALGTTNEAAQPVVAALQALAAAEGPQAQADASMALAEAMAAAAGGAMNLDGTAADLYRTLLDTAAAGYDASAGIDALDVSTRNAAAGAISTANAYQQLADAVARANSEQKARLKAATDPLTATEDPRTSHALRGISLSYEDRLLLDRDDPRNPNYRASTPRSGRAGGGGGRSEAEKAADKAQRDLERQQENQRRVEEGLQREIALLGAGEITRRVYNETLRAGVDLYSEAGLGIAKMVIAAESAQTELDRVAEVNQYAAETFGSLFNSAIEGAESFKDALSGVLRQLGEMAINRAFLQMISGTSFGGGAGGGLFSSLFGIGKEGFATGGSFKVGGSGGTDSQLVTFRATPGEMVDIRRPGQSGNSASLTFAPVINAQGADASALAKVQEQLGEMERRFGEMVQRSNADPRFRGAF